MSNENLLKSVDNQILRMRGSSQPRNLASYISSKQLITQKFQYYEKLKKRQSRL